jgi:hypothetical protein
MDEGNASHSNCLPTKRLALALAAAAALGIAGCAYRGGLDQPIERKLSWFSYLGADDIRASCVPGAPDRYRLVYNGDYEKQVRTYDLVADGAGGALLTARASRPVDLSSFTVSDLSDLGGPWRWAKSTMYLPPDAFADLRRRLDESGFAAGAPEGLTLYSAGFWWLAAGCEAARFHFAAWAYPDAGFRQLEFPERLLAFDGTGVAVNPPHVLVGDPLTERGQPDERSEQRFALTVHADGIGRLLPPL